MVTRIDQYFELVVAGGGLAGLCCAIAAARKGVKTALVQDRPVLGGNSSSEIRVTPAGSVDFASWTMETGIIEEILLEERANNPTDFGDGATNSLYDICLYRKALKEPNLTVFLSISVRDVETSERPDGSRVIHRVLCSQLGTGKEYAFAALQFVDCTGDAALGFLAGADYRYGRDARAEFGENLAPLIADDHTMGSSLNFYARNVHKPVPFNPPDWAKKYRSKEEIGLRRDIHIRPDRVCGFWWMELSKPFHQVADTETIKHELMSHILGVWDYYKNYSEQREQLSTYSIEWIGCVPGKRESRRLMGDVIVTEHDLHRDPQWPDAVATSAAFIDIHINGGILNKCEPPELSNTDTNYGNYTNVGPYTIPLRALYSRNIGNLWMAGRDISVSRVALGSMRTQIILANIGQAVGTAAAHAIRHELLPRELCAPDSPHVKKVQTELLKDDVNILGLPYLDEANLASDAEVEVSSEGILDLSEPDLENFVSLAREHGQVIPVTEDRMEAVELYLQNRSGKEIPIRVSLTELENIWDKSNGIPVTSVVLSLPANFNGWFKVPLAASTNKNRPYRIALKAKGEVFWAKCLRQATGTLAQLHYVCEGGCDRKNFQYPSFRPEELVVPHFDKWNELRRGLFSFACKVEPSSRPYGGDSMVNPYNRPCQMPNVWISANDASLPQQAVIQWKHPKCFNRVVIFFDTDLNSLHSLNPGLWKARECVRDWQLCIWDGTSWVLAFEESGNYQRQRTVDLAPVTTDKILIRVTATNGDPQARIYGVRVYQD